MKSHGIEPMIAGVFEALGEPDAALDWLERGCETRAPFVCGIGFAIGLSPRCGVVLNITSVFVLLLDHRSSEEQRKSMVAVSKFCFTLRNS